MSSLVPHLAAKLEKEESTKKNKKKPLTIAIDGKEIRSTGKMKKYDSPLHIVSAQIGELGLPLAQRTVEAKSNEIPAVPELIKKLDISGCMVIGDALNCQREPAKADRSVKRSRLFVTVKGNQKEPMNDIAQYVLYLDFRAAE